MNASYAGDGRRACRLYTRAYQREILRENRKLGAATCEELIEAMEPVLQQLTPNPAPKVTRVRLAGDRATARVEITTAFGPAASKRFLAREDDRWKITHDEDLREGPSPLAR